MTKIHPTAIVDSSAILHPSVEVGAFTIIGPNVEIGENTTIGHHSYIAGHTKIGKNNRIFQFNSLGDAPQDKKYKGEPTRLEIGDNNTIREFCTFNTGTMQGNEVTRVGNNNWIMAYVHIAHDCIVGGNIILANSATLAGHVTIKDWAIMGGQSSVHRFTIIGEHSMIAGFTGVAQDVPPYIMAWGYRAEPRGINSEGLKRRGFSATQIENIKQAYKLLYRNGLTFNEAKTFITEMAQEHEELKAFIEFFEESTRGIIR